MKTKQLEQARTLYALRHYKVQKPAQKNGGSHEQKTIQKLKNRRGRKNHTYPKFVDCKLNPNQLVAVQKCHEFNVEPSLFSIEVRYIKKVSNETIINEINSAYYKKKKSFILSIDDSNFSHKLNVIRSLGLKYSILKYRIYYQN